MVKLEGGAPVIEVVKHLYNQGIPVCGHLGLTPQHVHRFGGFRIQGREQAAAEQLQADALSLQQAGAQMLVLECVPAQLAATVTASLDIPVIGIGAGADVDGQVLVLYDVIGLTVGKPPSFSKNFLTAGRDIQQALQAYTDAVHSGEFPGPEHAFK